MNEKKRLIIKTSGLIMLLAIGLVLTMMPQKDADAAGSVYRWNIAMRDPFIMRVGNMYYMYGTTGTGFKGYYSADPNLEVWYGPYTVFSGSGWGGTFWAPEVHQVGSYYYMFATMKPGTYRGTYVLRSSSPLGTYTSWSTGPVTDTSKHCIDGTLHYEGSTPWMVYVDEWTNYNPTVGKMRAVQLASDLKTRIASTDRLLFTAQAPSWSRGILTDGPQMYKTANGTLLMLWSTYAYYNASTSLHYTVALARSSNGTITGSWSQVGSKPLFYGDGGHGMALTMADGSKKFVYHAYNSPGGDERPVFIDLYESSSTLTLGNVPWYVQAYWRFEDAPKDGQYFQPGTPVLDFSGNGNDLHTYSSGTAGRFLTAIPCSSVRETGDRNRFSYDNNISPGTGHTTRDLYTPAHMNPPLKNANYYNWTIEASIKLGSLNKWQAIVGRDGNIVSSLQPFVLKVTNQNKVMIEYVQADSRVGSCTNNTTLLANVWYDVVAVKWGTGLHMYVKTSSSTYFPSPTTTYLSGNTYMYNNSGTWTVGRGMYNGVIADQFWGCIDEVRISHAALSTSYFLQTP